MSLLRTFTSVAQKNHIDVAVIGGGVVGSSVAHHASKLLGRDSSIVVIERDPSYKFASAVLSAGGIRQQFSVKENILMSLYGVEFVNNIAEECKLDRNDMPDIQFHQNGYLYLATNQGKENLYANNQVQRSVGVDWIDLLNPSQLQERFPWLNTDNLVLGSHGTKNEGWFDPWALLCSMKQSAIQNGVRYMLGSVKKINKEEKKITTLEVCNSSGNVEEFTVGIVVNAAGPFAGEIIKMCSAHPIPVYPRKRCVFVFHCSSPDSPNNAPLTIDPSGVYFRPEGGNNRFICGVSPLAHLDEDCTLDDLRNVDYNLFDEVIWPALYERVPAFGSIKVQSSWAGLYEYNVFDQNAIIGYHPDVSNLILVNGFSGHGLQQSPASGRAVSELITHGKFKTIDLSCFGFERVLNNSPIFEKNII